LTRIAAAGDFAPDAFNTVCDFAPDFTHGVTNFVSDFSNGFYSTFGFCCAWKRITELRGTRQTY